MDTRQLQAFCEVVERKSFSQAAERLGVTQPAVSLQVRSLEKRLGTQLLDRSGRRVEPTEAGLRFYRGAQRLLALEEEVVHDVSAEAEGDLTGILAIGASTGPGGVMLPRLLCEFAAAHPQLHVALTVSDTQTIVDRVSDRSLQLGVVGAAPRHRAVTYDPFFRDELVLALPPGHRFAGHRVSLDELREETLILMQEGAGVRDVVEDELRALGVRLADMDVRLELGLQESVVSAVRAGFGVAFISRSAIEDDLAGGRLAEARVIGLEAEREIWVVRATGRSQTRVASTFIEFAKARLV
jgi:DNA-binding transcriptional LysR family regulator